MRTRLAIILLFLISIAVNSYAASRVFYENFDDGNANEFDTATADVVTTSPHSGSYCGRANWQTDGDNQSTSNFVKSSWSYTNETFIRFWVKIDPNCYESIGTLENAKVMRLSWDGENSDYTMTLQDDTNGTYHDSWYVNGSFVLNCYSSGTLSPGTWHKVEIYIKHDTDGSDGVIKIWTDDVLNNNSCYPYNGDTYDGDEYWYPFHFPSNWTRTDGEDPEPNYIYIDDVEIYSDQGTGATGSMADGTITVDSGSTRSKHYYSGQANFR